GLARAFKSRPAAKRCHPASVHCSPPVDTRVRGVHWPARNRFPVLARYFSDPRFSGQESSAVYLARFGGGSGRESSAPAVWSNRSGHAHRRLCSLRASAQPIEPRVGGGDRYPTARGTDGL